MTMNLNALTTRVVVKPARAVYQSDFRCHGCGSIEIGPPQTKVVIANVYEDGRWVRREVWHLTCYQVARSPHGEPVVAPVVKPIVERTSKPGVGEQAISGSGLEEAEDAPGNPDLPPAPIPERPASMPSELDALIIATAGDLAAALADLDLADRLRVLKAREFGLLQEVM